jgi:hypothetical protein
MAVTPERGNEIKVDSAFAFVTAITGHLQRLLMGFGYRLYPSYILPIYLGYAG